ncbi:MAG: YdcF family protein [Fuerstiella sp.]|nr:YdcF family protein [Fuerstiella sp.]
MSTGNAPKEVRILRLMFRMGVVTVILLAGVWFFYDRMAAQKIATSLAMPCGVIWYLLSCSIFAARSAGNSKITWTLAAIWLTFTGLGNGILAGSLSYSLEAPYSEIRPLEQQPFDYVIVLGGGASEGANDRNQGNGGGDRLILAAQLYHAGLAGKLICTGQRIASMDASSMDTSERSQDVLTRLGVPESAIEIAGGRNSSEEMQSLGQRFADTGQRVGLVTSAWHLQRVMRLAKRNNFAPHPLPADFTNGPASTKPTWGQIVQGLIPHEGNMTVITKVATEYLGMLVGRLRNAD